MLKRLAILTAILMLGALPALAESPRNGGPDLTQFLKSLNKPAATAASAPTQGTIALASKPGKPGTQEKSCMAIEDCDGLPDISCSGTVCNAVSRDCTIGGCERGSVTCNGVTTFCSQVCPPNCTFLQCRLPCKVPGCFSTCIDTCTCECETICQ